MADSVSKQIAAVQETILEVANDCSLSQEATFKLGSVYAKLETAKRTVAEQEIAYASMCKMYMARNPKKTGQILQGIVDIVSGKNLIEDEEVIEDGRTEKNLG